MNGLSVRTFNSLAAGRTNLFAVRAPSGTVVVLEDDGTAGVSEVASVVYLRDEGRYAVVSYDERLEKVGGAEFPTEGEALADIMSEMSLYRLN